MVTITQNMWAVILQHPASRCDWSGYSDPLPGGSGHRQQPVIKLVREATLRDDNVAAQLQKLVAHYAGVEVTALQPSYVPGNGAGKAGWWCRAAE